MSKVKKLKPDPNSFYDRGRTGMYVENTRQRFSYPFVKGEKHKVKVTDRDKGFKEFWLDMDRVVSDCLYNRGSLMGYGYVTVVREGDEYWMVCVEGTKEINEMYGVRGE